MTNPILDELTTTVTNTEGVIESATAFINGVPALIDAAVQKALEGGATPEQLAPLTQLSADLKAKADALAAAVAANAPPTP